MYYNRHFPYKTKVGEIFTNQIKNIKRKRQDYCPDAFDVERITRLELAISSEILHTWQGGALLVGVNQLTDLFCCKKKTPGLLP